METKRTVEEVKNEYGQLAMMLGHNKYTIEMLEKQNAELMEKMLKLNHENAELLKEDK